MEAVPIEILLAILNYLDIGSLLKLSTVCKTLHEQINEPYVWLSACRQNALVKAFIDSANLQSDLVSGKLNARSFLLHFLKGNGQELRSLIADCQHMLLWFPIYEKGDRSQQFFKPISSAKRLFLSKEIAQELILNLDSVKGFSRACVPLDFVDLDLLINKGVTYYKNPKAPSVPIRPLHKRKTF